MSRAALEEVTRRVMARYHPVGNEHPDPLDAKEISDSQLIKWDAGQYAHRIKHRIDDDSSGYGSYRGNTLADEAFADIKYHDYRIERPLKHGWKKAGHFDALYIHEDGAVVVCEHKSHENGTEDKVLDAYRQALNYLGSIFQALADSPDGTLTLYPSKFTKRDDGPCVLKAGHHYPAGVWIGVADDTVFDGRPIEFVVTPEQAIAAAQHYDAKALAVIETAIELDDEAADEFDLTHYEPRAAYPDTLELEELAPEIWKWERAKDEAKGKLAILKPLARAALQGAKQSAGPEYVTKLKKNYGKRTVRIRDVEALADAPPESQEEWSEALLDLISPPGAGSLTVKVEKKRADPAKVQVSRVTPSQEA